jgi:hypothetical protein
LVVKRGKVGKMRWNGARGSRCVHGIQREKGACNGAGELEGLLMGDATSKVIDIHINARNKAESGIRSVWMGCYMIGAE